MSSTLLRAFSSLVTGDLAFLGQQAGTFQVPYLGCCGACGELFSWLLASFLNVSFAATVVFETYGRSKGLIGTSLAVISWRRACCCWATVFKLNLCTLVLSSLSFRSRSSPSSQNDLSASMSSLSMAALLRRSASSFSSFSRSLCSRWAVVGSRIGVLVSFSVISRLAKSLSTLLWHLAISLSSFSRITYRV